MLLKVHYTIDLYDTGYRMYNDNKIVCKTENSKKVQNIDGFKKA